MPVRSLTVAALICGLWTVDCGQWTAHADNQGYPTTLGTLTNIPPIAWPSAVSNTASWIPVKQGTGLSLHYRGAMSTATNAPVSLYLAQSQDGTNYTSTTWTWTFTANGTNTVDALTNWTRGSLDGIQFLVLTGITNAAGSSATNTTAGVMTNGSVMWLYPNQ